MSKENEKLKQLENKIDDLFKMVEKTRDKLVENQVNMIKASSQHHSILAQTMGDMLTSQNDFIRDVTILTENWRQEIEKRDRKLQHSVYYKGLIMGLLLGVVGNLLVSYLMKVLEVFEIPSWGWVLSMIVALALTFLLIWMLNREGKKTPKQ